MIIDNSHSNRGTEFVPLLEYHFCEPATFIKDQPKIVDYYIDSSRSRHSFTKNECSGVKVSLDLVDLVNVDYILVTEVSQVINLIKLLDSSYSKIPGTVNKLKVLCNLATHNSELNAAGFNSELLLSGEPSRLIDLGCRKLTSINKPLINPDYATDQSELISAKYYIKYLHGGYNWSQANYANEYCKVYQLANIYNKEVKIALTESELKFWMTK